MRATVRQQIQDEIAAIEPFDQLERKHLADARQWVATSTNIFRVERPDKPPKHLVSYCVLIDPDHRSILLGELIKANLWLPSGGHVELDEHPRQTVYRETQEELGQPAIFLRGNQHPFFLTITDTVGPTAGHTDVSLWYLLRGNVHDRIDFERREFADVAWFTFDEIMESHPAIFDKHMHRFTQKLMDYLLRSSGGKSG